MFGIGTNKAAKTFTPQEQHKKPNNNVYTCQNVACEMIQETYTVVSEKICMTDILDIIRIDRCFREY